MQFTRYNGIQVFKVFKVFWLTVLMSLMSGCAILSNGAGDTAETEATESATEQDAIENADANNETTNNTDNTIAGTYYARLPCADCRGIRVDLVLSDDGYYEALLERLGDNDSELLIESGQWAREKTTVRLTPDTATADANNSAGGQSALLQRFEVQGNGLKLLKASGAPYEGRGASAYLFEKK